MANDRVKVSLGRTINLGNFESFRVDVGLEADVRPNETRDARFKLLQKECEKQVDAICAPIEQSLEQYNKSRKG